MPYCIEAGTFAAFMAIHFQTNDTHYKISGRKALKLWLAEVVRLEGKTLGTINIILCTDSYLLEMNNQYLQHDYYTDIITFDYCQGDKTSGDLFISIDRVKENSQSHSLSQDLELQRVMVHGVLHLLGYDDKGKQAKGLMTSKEDEYLHIKSKTVTQK